MNTGAMRTPEIHLITPGDHFSPLTGSAIPTVVHGLAGEIPPGQKRAAVLVARGTYAERYGSADIIEYDTIAGRRADRYIDPVAGCLGLPRPGARRSAAVALTAQTNELESAFLLHNAPQAVGLVDGGNQSVLYAHNELLRSYSRREVRRALGRVDAIVCVSRYLAERTARHLGPSLRERLHVVPNGVNAAEFELPRARDEHGRLRVAFLGRVIPDKGVRVLIDAVRSLGRVDIDVTVIGRAGFAGDDPLTAYERELRRAAREVVGRVRFASFVPRPHLPAVLSETDVLVVPSLWPEPFGLTALEGMAAGAAVVASEVGGLPEAVGGAGILVPPGDAHALAGVLEALADDDSTLQRAQQASRSRAEAMSWSHARARLDDVLTRI